MWQKFLQNFFNCPCTVPIEAYHIETSTLPLRYALLQRKFMFLWTILNKPDDELIKKVFLVQKEFSTSDSWVSTVESEIEEYDINLTFNDISKITKSRFKELVSQKIRVKAVMYVTSLQAQHSKTKFLTHSNQMKPYLTSIALSLKEK